jgi:hypothetical protein
VDGGADVIARQKLEQLATRARHHQQIVVHHLQN